MRVTPFIVLSVCLPVALSRAGELPAEVVARVKASTVRITRESGGNKTVVTGVVTRADDKYAWVLAEKSIAPGASRSPGR